MDLYLYKCFNGYLCITVLCQWCSFSFSSMYHSASFHILLVIASAQLYPLLSPIIFHPVSLCLWFPPTTCTLICLFHDLSRKNSIKRVWHAVTVSSWLYLYQIFHYHFFIPISQSIQFCHICGRSVTLLFVSYVSSSSLKYPIKFYLWWICVCHFLSICQSVPIQVSDISFYRINQVDMNMWHYIRLWHWYRQQPSYCMPRMASTAALTPPLWSCDWPLQWSWHHWTGPCSNLDNMVLARNIDNMWLAPAGSKLDYIGLTLQ